MPFELDVPELDVPELDVPELDVPELDVPELDVPELDVPELVEPELVEGEADFPDVEAEPVDDEPADVVVLWVEPGSVRATAPAVTTLAMPTAVVTERTLPRPFSLAAMARRILSRFVLM